ncbi:MAG: electron transfer flavoprotein subunit alpha/FixB family protein [Candidatus Alcyoniella australis]|nr:electron transfer flavoprotein subunit alpha/FixB family protein [Candidatus Alcyoniella australis]
MSKILVIAELKGSEPKKITFELLSAAKNLGETADVAAIGKGLAGIGALVGPYGADNVYLLESDALADYSNEGYAKVLADLINDKGYELILFGSTTTGKDLAPRLAAKLGIGIAADTVDINKDGDRVVARRPVFAGKAFNDVIFRDGKGIVAIRPNVIAVAEPEAGKAAAENVVAADAGVIKAVLKETVEGESDRPDLTEADRIVSGGRAMKAAENFKILEDLADAIGATIGASRAAVDSGFAPQSWQVGQTGKVVNPSLYLAFGISGAIQHLAGMRTSKVIVAVNKDVEAPIFQKADYGIVDDLFEVVPLLTEEFKKLLAE